MPYNKEIVSRARALLAQQKADRESQQAARIREAYARFPRLRQIDDEQRGNMSAAIKVMLSTGSDAIQQAKEANQALQQEYDAIVNANFPQGYLDDSPLCPSCGGSGYLGSAMCDCLKKLCLQEQRRELGAIFNGTMTFDSFRLDYYSRSADPRFQVTPRELMEKNLEHCRRYARSFRFGSGNLLFIGGTGLGKTHLALATGSVIGEQGFTVCYESAISLFSKLEKARFTPTDENRAEADRLTQCDFLIIDDLGTEMPGQFITSALYGLLNERLMTGKPMLITTNLNVDDMGKRYSPQIASRLYGEFLRITFLGTDIRVLKNQL